jgi:hypothetical protein
VAFWKLTIDQLFLGVEDDDDNNDNIKGSGGKLEGGSYGSGSASLPWLPQSTRYLTTQNILDPSPDNRLPSTSSPVNMGTQARVSL